MWSQPKAAKRSASLSSLYFHVISIAFGLHLSLRIFHSCSPNTIAQASVGSPCVSVRLRVLGGWVGILLGMQRVLRIFLGRVSYNNRFWKPLAAEVLCD